jgi:hypothetical protein
MEGGADGMSLQEKFERRFRKYESDMDSPFSNWRIAFAFPASER